METLNIKIGGVDATPVGNIQKRISLMLWGAPGVGKTMLAATAPGKKLWLLFDPNGADSLEFSPEKDNCTVVDLSKQSHSITLQGCMENPFGIEQYLKNDTFDTVVFDSATVYLDLCLKQAVSTTKNATVDVPTQAGYSRRNSLMKQTLNNLIKLTNKYNKHIIIIGHEDNGQMDDLGNLIKQSVMIGGSSNTAVCITLSEIWYMSQLAGKRKIHFAPFGVKTPIKTRMIDTNKTKFVEWNYDLENGGVGIKDWFEMWKNSANKISF